MKNKYRKRIIALRESKFAKKHIIPELYIASPPKSPEGPNSRVVKTFSPI